MWKILKKLWVWYEKWAYFDICIVSYLLGLFLWVVLISTHFQKTQSHTIWIWLHDLNKLRVGTSFTGPLHGSPCFVLSCTPLHLTCPSGIWLLPLYYPQTFFIGKTFSDIVGKRTQTNQLNWASSWGLPEEAKEKRWHSLPGSLHPKRSLHNRG